MRTLPRRAVTRRPALLVGTLLLCAVAASPASSNPQPVHDRFEIENQTSTAYEVRLTYPGGFPPCEQRLAAQARMVCKLGYWRTHHSPDRVVAQNPTRMSDACQWVAPASAHQTVRWRIVALRGVSGCRLERN